MMDSLKAENKTWHQIVFGTTGEESMKCLRYCISWLQYALKYLNQQMSILRSFLVSLATNAKDKPDEQVLLSIKRNMVGTIRKVIDIITMYASTALPYQAKAAVRRTILSLPNRWASINDENDDKKSMEKEIGIQDSILRLLVFGQESTDMLQSIHSVFQDTIQRAENWLGKLRMIKPIKSPNDDDCSVLLPPIRNLHLSLPE